ncbi:MAG: hypothetical protein OJF59_000458 [Cytophagales bacterium]|jgi:hypothetical protein|nr:MAG: hypothetical protein OJF59_000458 [Cytophagales bacterium]
MKRRLIQFLFLHLVFTSGIFSLYARADQPFSHPFEACQTYRSLAAIKLCLVKTTDEKYHSEPEVNTYEESETEVTHLKRGAEKRNSTSPNFFFRTTNFFDFIFYGNLNSRFSPGGSFSLYTQCCIRLGVFRL